MASNSSVDRDMLLQTSFAAGMRRYGQVIFALLQREYERRRLSPMASLADVLEPVAFIFIMSLLWAFLNRRTSSPLGDDPVLFISTGFYAKFFWINVARINRGSIGFAARRFPIERRFDHILVHVLFTCIDYIALGIFGFMLLYVFFTPTALPFDFAPIVGAILAIVALGFGWGMMSLVISRYFWPWSYLAGLFNRALVLFSGIFFLAEFLPPGPREWLALNPMFHAIALFRCGFYPNYPQFLLDTTYLTYCSLFAVFIGVVLERLTARQDQEEK